MNLEILALMMKISKNKNKIELFKLHANLEKNIH